MQLVVTVAGFDDEDEAPEFELNTFADQDKVAARIARAVRNWIRVVPVRASGSRLNLAVTASWVEASPNHTHTKAAADAGAPAPKRKKKARK